MSAGEDVPEREEPPARRESRGGWLSRVLQAVSGEPRDREDLLDDLREAGESGLIDAEAASMVEGVLAVADQQVLVRELNALVAYEWSAPPAPSARLAGGVQ